MDNRKPVTFLSILPAVLVFMIVGWVGLAALIIYSLPTLGPRWLFFFFAMLAITGTALPIVYFFNLRFPSKPPAEAGVLLRQAIWVGVYGSVLIWLQLGRMLTITVAGLLAGALVLIEVILRMREISRWRPGAASIDGE